LRERKPGLSGPVAPEKKGNRCACPGEEGKHIQIERNPYPHADYSGIWGWYESPNPGRKCECCPGGMHDPPLILEESRRAQLFAKNQKEEEIRAGLGGERGMNELVADSVSVEEGFLVRNHHCTDNISVVAKYDRDGIRLE